jgi:hypothetical protein
MSYMSGALENEKKNLSKSIIYVFIQSISVETNISYIIHSSQLFQSNSFLLYHYSQLE